MITLKIGGNTIVGAGDHAADKIQCIRKLNFSDCLTFVKILLPIGIAESADILTQNFISENIVCAHTLMRIPFIIVVIRRDLISRVRAENAVEHPLFLCHSLCKWGVFIGYLLLTDQLILSPRTIQLVCVELLDNFEGQIFTLIRKFKKHVII